MAKGWSEERLAKFQATMAKRRNGGKKHSKSTSISHSQLRKAMKKMAKEATFEDQLFASIGRLVVDLLGH